MALATCGACAPVRACANARRLRCGGARGLPQKARARARRWSGSSPPHTHTHTRRHVRTRCGDLLHGFDDVVQRGVMLHRAHEFVQAILHLGVALRTRQARWRLDVSSGRYVVTYWPS